MTRSFKDWWDIIPSDLKEKALNSDKSNTILLNQVNYVLLHLELEGKHEAKSSHGELRTWLHNGQVNVVRIK
jgi:hypothetical protein